MSLTRQGRRYLIIGGLQWLVDWGVMVALSHLGMPVEPANIIGRISGALLGFWLNGSSPSPATTPRSGARSCARFVMMWLCTTAISTWALGAIDEHVGLKWAWLAKPVVELVLGGDRFLLSRHWVYKALGAHRP